MPSSPLIVSYKGTAPEIAPTAWIAPNATVIGRVRLGAETSVFFGAVLRGDVDSIEIAARSNLQDNVAVHCDQGIPTRVGSGVSVGHSAILHGCAIEDDCLIGMGATVLNRAVVGAGSLVAAGAVVLEGSIVPPGSLVAGVPARVRRELTEAERARLRDNATRYVALSRDYAAGDPQ
jgi:carbonic anhydrase/acetyltransferase-like protein (isoleucine patch superfamily)